MARHSALTEKYKAEILKNILPDGRPLVSWNAHAEKIGLPARTVRHWVRKMRDAGEISPHALKPSAVGQAAAHAARRVERAKADLTYDSLLAKLLAHTETGSDTTKLAAIRALIEETRASSGIVGPPEPSTPESYTKALLQIFKLAPPDALRTAWELHNAPPPPENDQNT